jgi:thioredoxin reductase (NADPH)
MRVHTRQQRFRTDRHFLPEADMLSVSLQTNVKGVFAIGDVRSGSTKRVASAVGEGAGVIAQIQGFLSRVY